MRPRDQVGRSSRLRAGIRHVARRAIGTTGWGGFRRRARAYTIPPTAHATTSTAPRITATSFTSMWGNTVVVIKMSDNTNRTETMNVATTFSHGRLTHGPEHRLVVAQQEQEDRGARQQDPGQGLHRGGDDARAGAPGMRTMVAASATIPVKAA